MPFVITEPQRIEGTKLGFAVYSYHFSFDDKINFEQKYDRKLMIFKLKDTPFNEVDKILHEEKFLFNENMRGDINNFLQDYVKENSKYVTDLRKMAEYFARSNNYYLKGKSENELSR